ncbi:hypothetical protein EDD15DRAFT_2379211 [Pisolithus albus]|nr:hypothetical protein EDD15DRAFT_2380331 [Pisolithus albus]KAI5981643.1 hypothetical protein EDD15DRAFT_2379211 [Pisolithus albus]
MARGRPRKAATQRNQQGSVLEDAGLTSFPESDSSTSSEHPRKRARSCSSRHSQPSTDDSGDDWQPPVIFESLKCAAGGDESDEADDIEDIGAAFPDNGDSGVSMRLIDLATRAGDDPSDETWLLQKEAGHVRQCTARPKEYRMGPDMGSKSARTRRRYRKLLQNQTSLGNFGFAQTRTPRDPTRLPAPLV